MQSYIGANDWSGIFCFRVQSLQSSELVKDFETSQRDMMIFAKNQAVDRLNTEVGPVSSVKGESWHVGAGAAAGQSFCAKELRKHNILCFLSSLCAIVSTCKSARIMVKTWALHVQLQVSFPCQTLQIQLKGKKLLEPVCCMLYSCYFCRGVLLKTVSNSKLSCTCKFNLGWEKSVGTWAVHVQFHSSFPGPFWAIQKP